MIVFFLAAGLFACKNDGQDTASEAGADSLATAQAQPSGQVSQGGNRSNFKFPDIEGLAWKLSEYEYQGEEYPPFDNSLLTLRIEGDKASGNGGCNDFQGSVSLKENGSVSFSNITKTRMRCANRMTQEVRFFEILESANAYEVNMVFLKLSGPKGKLTFRNDNN